LVNDGGGGVEEEADAERIARLDEVDHVVADTLAGLYGRLGGADVHAFVNLYGIDTYDFGTGIAGQVKGQTAFA
jgi:hypothetical protein